MPHVLPVPAHQIGDPVAMLVLMESDDRLMHHSINYVVIVGDPSSSRRAYRPGPAHG